MPAKALAKLEKWFEVSAEEVKADAEARSRDIALSSIPALPDRVAALPWIRTGAQRDDQIIREYGSVENYLRISAELQAANERASNFQMQLWDALGQIRNLKEEIGRRDRREEQIKKTLNAAFYGEP